MAKPAKSARLTDYPGDLGSSEAEFRAVFEQSAVGMGRVSFKDARWIDVNGALCEMLGYTREEMCSKPWPRVTHPDDVNLDLVSFQRMARGELDSYSVEKRFIHKQGHVVWARLTLSLVRDRSGRPDYEIAVVENITRRKRSEEILKAREAELSEAQRIARLGSWYFDSERNTISWSDQCFRVLGLDPQADSGLVADAGTYQRLFSPEGNRKLNEALQRTRENGTPFELELELSRPDGDRRWLVIRGESDSVGQGGGVRIRGTVQDITDRKEIEQRALLNEAKLKSVLDHAPVGLFGADRNGMLEYLNPAGLEVWGAFRKVDLKGYDQYRGWRMDTGERLKAGDWALAKALQTGRKVSPQRVRIESFDGKEKFVLNAAGPVLGKNGDILGAVAITQDITDLVRAEQEVERRTEQLQAIIDGVSNTIIFVKDLEGRFITVNRHFENLLGISRDEVKGKTDYDLGPKDEADLYSENDRKVLESGSPARIEEPLALPDGKVHVFLSEKFPLLDAAGKPYALCGVSVDITDRKAAEEELARSRERLALAVRNAHVGFFDWDLISNHLVLSDQLMRDWGLASGEYDGTIGAALEMIHPDDRERVRRQIDAAIQGHQPFDSEYRVVRPGGTVLWTDVHATVIYAGDGRPLRFFGTSVDITERKRAEEEVLLTMQRLRATFDHAGVGIMEVEGAGIEDADDTIVNVNDRLCEILGCRKSELLGRTVRELTAPEDRELSESMNRKIHDGLAERVSYDKRYLKFNGERINVSVTLTAVRDSWGRHWRTVTTVEDITSRKKAEESLKESESRFRTYAEAMPQMAFIADAAGGIVYYNERFYEYVGEMEARGWRWKDQRIIHPEDLPRTLACWSTSLKTGEPYQVEYRLRRADGEYRWFLARAVPVRDRDGVIQQWLGTNTDIHEQKQIALELEKAVRARDEFLSIASHELKTPLSSLKLQAQLFLRGIAKGRPDAFTPEKITRMAEQTDTQVSRLVRLVDDMLDVSRIESGKLHMELERVDLLDIVRDVVERMRPQMLASGTDPRFAREDSVVGSWDPFRIEQVVANLLTNAIRYGAGKPVTISVERWGPDHARLIVQDRGMGISAADHSRIFERFERAILSTEVSGLGLGLFISREIVERHGGRMWVESELGRGARFSVELPLSEAVAETKTKTA